MAVRLIKRDLLTLVLTLVGTSIFAQDNVPLGINYQAVARDNFGNELAGQRINVRFSIIAGDPLSSPVFQEVHQNVLTTRYGVFSLIIGQGVSTGSYKCKNLSEINWPIAPHSLKVEVQFEGENDFMDMGTMQFLSVPYALYAQKSLEPGPPGPKGDPGPQGDPASDHQNLSVVNIDGSDYLAISGGNQVKVSTIEKDGDPTNELQDLIYDNAKMELRMTKSSPVIDLSGLKNDADSDPTNEIQDLKLTGDKLTITGKTSPTEINLAPYRDNTDNQTLNLAGDILSIAGGNSVNFSAYRDNTDNQTLNLAGDILSISGGNTVNLSAYKDNTDNQTLTYTESSNTLQILGGNSVTLGTMVAFRAKKLVATSAPMPLSNVDFIPDNIEYNDGNGMNSGTGEFTAANSGVYSFDIKYVASGDGKIVYLYKNGNLYETLATGLTTGAIIFRTMTIKLVASDKIKMVINTGTDTSIGTGTFSGYKVY